MKWFNQLLYDIKRLCGHGKLILLVFLTPILLVGVFFTVFIPLLSEGHGANIPFAICNDDKSAMVDTFFEYNMGKRNDIATYYPVQDMETGMRLLQEEKISVLLHIPSGFYETIDAGEDAEIYLYYLPKHVFEATMIQLNLNNNLAFLGQSQNILSLAADVANEHGFSQEQTEEFLNFCIDESILSYSRRSVIFQKNGEITATGDYMPAEYYFSILFALCLLFSMFPTIQMTADDLNVYYRSRKLSIKQILVKYTTRLITGALVNSMTLLICIPVSMIFKKLNGISLNIAHSSLIYLAISIPMMSIAFSALAILIAVISDRTNTALWVGLYISFLMIAVSGIFTEMKLLPEKLLVYLQLLPFKAAIGLVSNALLKFNQQAYSTNMLYLFLCTCFCMIIGGFVYYRKASPNVRRIR